MKRSPIRQVSAKQAIEIAARCRVKRELIEQHGEVCQTCNNEHKDWRGISLSHIIPLSRGGKTTIVNLELLCYHCHSLRHGIKEVIDGRPENKCK